jgi:hypothetical protein
MRLFKILMAVLVPLLLVGGIALAQGGSGIGWYEIPGDVRIGGQVAVTNASGVTSTDFTSTDDVVVGDDLTVTDDTTLTGDLAVGGTHSMDVDGPTTVTTDGTIDCSTGGLHLLSAAGNVQTSLVTTTSTEGVMCILLNEANVTIVLTDTGALKLTGNASITQFDTLCLISANSVWHEACKNAN